MRTLNDALSYTRPPTTLDLHVAFLPSSSHPAPYSATTALVRLLSQVAYPLSAGTPVRLIFENPEPRADRHPSEQADGAGFEGEIAGTRGTIQGVEELVARNTKPQARFRRAIIRLPTLPSAPAHSDIAPELFQRLLEISVERLNDARHTGRRPNNYFQARPDEELRRWDLAYLRPQLGTFQPELSGPRTESCDQREEQPAVGTESSRDQSANALPPIHAWWTPPTTTGTAVNAALRLLPAVSFLGWIPLENAFALPLRRGVPRPVARRS
ncbi:hypothetical protein BD413DRAFT_607858 [Trametes elegans]|nr:hypothetical protein BD413DRAFT_607858 [Trametes elegans]